MRAVASLLQLLFTKSLDYIISLVLDFNLVLFCTGCSPGAIGQAT